MDLLLRELKRKNPDLKPAEIEGILYLLLCEKDLTNNALVRNTGLPKQTLKEFKTSLGQLLERKGDPEKILLTVEGTQRINELNPQPYEWSVLSYRDVDVENKLDAVRKKYDLVPKREFDQFFATSMSSVAKAKMLISKGLVDGKNIALLGDDDLISITLPLLVFATNSKHMNYRITVFDIDKDILSLIQTICKDLGIQNVQTKQYDARNSVADSELHQYDIVMMDPPYTKSGISLFVNRGIELLKPHDDFSGNYLFLFYGNSFKSPEKTLKIQDIINRCNFLIEDKIDKFVRYFGAESIGSASSLYVLKTTPFTTSVQGTVESGIYTYESEKEEKFPYVDHVVLKIWNVDRALITSKNRLLRVLEEFCKLHMLKVVSTEVTQFKNLGFTYTFILSNSNLVIHTWPEFSAMHMDLITCKPIHARSSLGTNIQRLLKTHKFEIRSIE